MTTDTTIATRQPADLKVRLRPDQRTWLDHYAKAENRSLNGAIGDLIDRALKEDPLRVIIRECDLGNGIFYDVSLGTYGDAFHEGSDLSAALAAARAKVKELGLPRDAVQVRAETKVGPVFGTVVPALDKQEAA